MPKVLSKPSYQIAAIATVVLFFFSSLRHILFKSGAYDLGIFDQAVYLISQREVPISSLMGFHILGDHAAWILYLLAIPLCLSEFFNICSGVAFLPLRGSTYPG